MNCIVTTTINAPTEAILKYAYKKDWVFVIVGDTKTPHEDYRSLEKFSHVIYLSPEDQEKKYKKLSDILGWKTIDRRNIGFVEAYNIGAEIIATVDDDNIPYDSWGKNILVNKEMELDLYEPEVQVFDPLSITNNNYLYHRGYPVELLSKRHNVKYKGKIKRRVLVQADLWDGDPDIDAIERIILQPIVKFDKIDPYCSTTISPFNSQNTFLSREVFPQYCVLPFVGRMDDIWGSYIMQHYFPNSVVYNSASVYQERNVQNLITNLEHEMIGYKHTNELLQDLGNYEKFLPEKTKEFLKIYKQYFN